MRERGTCTNRTWLPLPTVDAAMLEAVERELLTPARLARAVNVARAQLAGHLRDVQATVEGVDARLMTLGIEIDRLTAAIAQGAALETVVAALKARETERTQLEERRREIGRVSHRSAVDEELAKLTHEVDRWRAMLRAHIPQRGNCCESSYAAVLSWSGNHATV